MKESGQILIKLILYLTTAINWDDKLKISEENTDCSTEVLLNRINKLLDCYAPFKKLRKLKLKFKTKPWITPDLQKSIKIIVN